MPQRTCKDKGRLVEVVFFLFLPLNWGSVIPTSGCQALSAESFHWPVNPSCCVPCSGNVCFAGGSCQQGLLQLFEHWFSVPILDGKKQNKQKHTWLCHQCGTRQLHQSAAACCVSIYCVTPLEHTVDFYSVIGGSAFSERVHVRKL